MASRVAIDADDAGRGLVGLVLALVEIVHALLKLQAVRRMESGSLAPPELERLGRTLLAAERGVEDLKRQLDLAEVVDAIRSDLDGLVERLLELEPEPERGERG